MKKKTETKKNNNMIMIGILIGVVALFGGIIYAIKSNTQKGENTKHIGNGDQAIDFSIVDDEDKLVKTRFLNKTEAEIQKANMKNKQATEEMRRMQQEMKNLKASIKKQKEMRMQQQRMQSQQQANTKDLPSPENKSYMDIFSKFPAGLPQTNKASTANPPIHNPFKEKKEIYYEYEEMSESMVLSDVAGGDKADNGIVKPNGKAHPTKTSSIPEDAFFIPAGSITVAYLEQGYDAPTLKNGKGDLVPSTLTIVGYTLLPNNKLYDLRGCKVLAEAEGKRSNERSYSRTQRLSCIDNQDRPMDIPLKGYISDEGGDGKLGLKGNIVSMQNKFLQNAVWIGIVEGLASIGKATSMTQSATAQGGVVSTINPGDEFKAGLAGSISDTTSSIKDFLMDNVKSIEPVVEIKGGRLVAITLSEGIYIYPRIEYDGRKDMK